MGWKRVGGAALAAMLLATLVAPAPAGAAGDAVPTGETYRFLARVEVGKPGVGQSCSGALVGSRWVLTAKACFGTAVVAGPPPARTAVVVGRRTATGAGDTDSVAALRLVPHPDRDLVLVQLAATVTGVRPVPVAATAPAADEVVSLLGYGRTGAEWVPAQPHLGSFRVAAVTGGLTTVAGTDPAQAGPCRGDAGGPGVRVTADGPELVGITHEGGQGGCLGVADGATRGGTQTRVDDVATWVRQTTAELTVNTVKNAYSGKCLALPSNFAELRAHAIQWGCGGAADQDWQLNPRGNGQYEIRDDRSGLCLALADGLTADRTHVLQWTCRDNPDQTWLVTKRANGSTEFRNVFSGKCLALDAGSKADGAHLVIWPCSANADQDWTVTPRTPGAWVRSSFSSLCLSNGGSTDDGAHAVQVACTDDNDAEWTLRTRGGDRVDLYNDRSGRCLAIEGGVKTAGAHLLQWPCRDNADQSWLTEVDPQGRVVLRNTFSDMCLAIAGGVKTAGAHLLQWNCNGNADQFWTVGSKA